MSGDAGERFALTVILVPLRPPVGDCRQDRPLGRRVRVIAPETEGTSRHGVTLQEGTSFGSDHISFVS